MWHKKIAQQKTLENSIYDIPIKLCLAKTWRKQDGTNCAGRDVYSHCLIVATVAEALLQRLPNWLTKQYFPDGSSLVAGCHDIGKLSPTFQRKIYNGMLTVASNMWAVICNADLYKEDIKLWGGHAGVSQATIKYLTTNEYIAKIVGQHHGFAPQLGVRQATDEAFGGKAWLSARQDLVLYLQTKLNKDFPPIQSELQAKLLAGLTTVADWIGSGRLFDDPNAIWEDKIQTALDEAGFIAPIIQQGLNFSQVFGFSPRATQTTLIEIANQTGVYILEAPMGLGKTEAALYAAYQLLAQNQATGIYFALPTQLTSDKIHERMQEFLTKILTPESLHSNPILLHSKSSLKQMDEDASPSGDWFSHGKRGILAVL